jgi:hypothetical protein
MAAPSPRAAPVTTAWRPASEKALVENTKNLPRVVSEKV